MFFELQNSGYTNNFVLRLTERRYLMHKQKKYKTTVLRDSEKRKIKMIVMFQDVNKECYTSNVNVRIRRSTNDVT